MIDEFIDFFEKENISSDLTINEVKDIIENNGYEINSSLENDALNIAIRKYRGIVFKDKDNIKKEISGILKDLEDKNNIKYFY